MIREDLTGLVSRWKAGTVTEGEAVDTICLAAWRQLRRLDEDERGDFILSFHPHIPGMLRRFDPRRGSFEVYLVATLKYRLRTFYSRQARRRVRQRMTEDPTFWRVANQEISGFSEPEECAELGSPGESSPVELLRRATNAYHTHNRRVHHAAFRKRLLYVTLKCSDYASPETLAEMAGFLRIDSRRLQNMALELSETVETRRERKQKLCQRRNEAAVRLEALRRELAMTVEEPWRTHLLRQAAQQERLCRSLRGEIDRIPESISNREIARLLRVPKGSVDSAIFYVRAVLQRQEHAVTNTEADRGGPGKPCIPAGKGNSVAGLTVLPVPSKKHEDTTGNPK